MDGLLPRPRRRAPGDAGVAEIPAVAPPPALLPPGRRASARLRIECAVRHAAAFGVVPPGAPLPGRAWFAKRFSASPTAVHAAFSALRDEGFVESRPRGETRLASRFPSDGRFLLVVDAAPGEEPDGLTVNLERAARRTEALRPGVSWTVFRRFADGGAAVREIVRDLSRQRYSGVFMRIAHSDLDRWAPGPDPVASVPDVPMAADAVYTGTGVSPMVRELGFSAMEPWCEVLADCRRTGRRRVAVLNAFSLSWPGEEEKVRAEAGRQGVEIPDGAYLSPASEEKPENVRRTFELLFRLVRPGDIDAVLVRRDGLLRPLAEALRARWDAKAAARIPVVCWSAGGLLRTEGLNVEWRGPDLPKTLLSFVDWCEAVHAGARDPAPPRVVR